jgi:hypothetical protein
MGRVFRAFGSRRFRIAFNGLFVLGALTALTLTVLHFMHTGWPLKRADPLFLGTAGALFIAAYAFKAWGWQRLFAPDERPKALTLAAAGGAAALGGVALPGRFDEAIRIAVVRRNPGKRIGFGALVLTIIVVGFLDSAALTPAASIAAAASKKGSVQAGFALVAAAGIASALIVFFLPRVGRIRFVARFKIGRWMQEHCACRRSASHAWLLISVSWALRAVAVFVLLQALAVGGRSFPIALAFLCASAASAALPIAPAGAATQAGAGAAILYLSGVPKGDAVAFALAAQAMIILAGALCVAFAGAWHLGGRLRRRSQNARLVRASV